MPDILSAFANESLFAASAKFLQHLGVKFSTQTEEPIPFLELYEEAATEANATIPKDIKAIFSRVENTYFIGTVTDDTLNGENAGVDFKVEAAKPKYEGMFVFAVEMKPGETLKRSEAAVLVRGINRVVKQMPATVLILEKHHAHTEARRHGGEDDLCDSVTPCEICLSVATCERTEYRQSWRPGERLGKVSILKGVNTLSPHRGHIDILESMNVKACKTFDALYKQWKDVFSTSLLTKQFYREIQNWYFWALKKEQHVAFPNALDDDSDDEKYNAENIIRLITRLIFTWFMKEKGLVNPDLFNPEFLKKALKYFNPEGAELFRQDLQDSQDCKIADNLVNPVNPVLKQEHSCTYYRAILQNLFFATFNQEVGLRDFVDTQVRDTKRYNIKNYYRNEKLFTEKDRTKIIGYFNGSPFVNGGLFECLDNVEQNGRVYSWDGFSNSVHFRDGSLKSALIPDCLFFGGETTTDLSEFFEKDKSTKSVKVRGIINILNDYVFTIEENTPFDEDVALDPELLGKVFENLLGCYNPETQQMARNATGSFYTPREIVNYMVKVTLKSYLKRACPKVVPAEIDALVEGVAELAEMPSVKEYAKDILTALFKAKILDPACGSGAFPMGIMSAIVEILRTVDPDNLYWHEIVLKESLNEAESIADIGDEQERAELRAQIEYDFKERVDHPDYARKLYVIEHCIFGSDIQPIAVQISRLRFFITLLCEQTKNDDPTKNYGITPLPNLESNFVAANSLLAIDLKDMRELLGQKKIVSLVKQLRGVRHQLFLPKTSDKKKRLQKRDEELRDSIANAAEGLYDENIELRCQMLTKDIKRCEDELAKLGEDDFKDVTQEVEEVDLFGEKTVTTKTIVGKGNAIIRRKAEAEASLESLKNASRKERLLTDLKRLVAWNPFAFNIAETFLDQEWMFGVKRGFDIVIANPPYIKEYENRKAFDGFREQSPYYIGKMDLWYGFACKGLDMLRDGGALCFIAQNNWTTSSGASKMREKVVTDSRILKMVDFNDYMIFESADIQTMVMLFLHDSKTDNYVFDHWRLNDGAGKDDVIDLISGNADCKCRYLTPSVKRKDLLGKMLTFSPADDLLAKIADGKEHLTEDEIAQGIVPNPDVVNSRNSHLVTDSSVQVGDGVFVVDKSKFANLDEAERKYVKPLYEPYQMDRYYIEDTTDKNILYISKANWRDDAPTLKEHLYKYRQIMQARRENQNGRLDYMHLHWPRVESFFTAGEKILAVRKCVDRPIFVFTEKPAYVMMAVNVIKTSRWNNKLLTAILNSRLIWFWLLHKGKMQGSNYQVDKEPLMQIPLVQPSPEKQAAIISLVDEIIAARKVNNVVDVSALEEKIDNLIFDLYGLTPEEREIVKGNGK